MLYQHPVSISSAVGAGRRGLHAAAGVHVRSRSWGTRTIVTKGNQAKSGTSKDTRIHTGELIIDHTNELCIPRCRQAERRRGDNTEDVERIARVLPERNGILDEGIGVGDTRRLGEVDHGVGVVLLRAGVCVGEEGVDAVDTSEIDARLVRENVTTAHEA